MGAPAILPKALILRSATREHASVDFPQNTPLLAAKPLELLIKTSFPRGCFPVTTTTAPFTLSAPCELLKILHRAPILNLNARCLRQRVLARCVLFQSNK